MRRPGSIPIVHCVFSGFTHLFPASVSKVAYHVEHSGCWGKIWGKPWKRLTEAGYDFIEIALNQAHRRGLTFLAGLRMNDRHSCRQKEKLYLEHPEWRLEGFPGGFDYSKQVVRDRMLAFVKEVLDQYEVDGIEYDWMRSVHVFPRGTEKKNGALLTDFHRRTRELVNQAARKRGAASYCLGCECRMFSSSVWMWDLMCRPGSRRVWWIT